MTLAGKSAGVEARRSRDRAEQHRRQAVAEEAHASRFEIARRTEAETAQLLAPLVGIGNHLVADLAWPGSTTANVDMVVVGASGVFIVDTKAWREVAIDGGRITRGQEHATDDVAALADLAWNTESALTEVGLARGEVQAVLAFAGRKGVHEPVASVNVVGVRDLIAHITRPQTRLTPSRVDEVLAAALRHFPVVGATPTAPSRIVIPAPVLPREQPPALALIDEDELRSQLLDDVLEAPIEE